MRSHRSRGQSLVEFALVIPLFLTLLLGVVDMGHVIWASSSLGAAAREAARYAIVHGGSASNPCPVGPPGPDVQLPVNVTASCPYPAPSRQSIVDTALNAALGVGGTLNATVCYGTGCSGNTDAVVGTDGNGQPVYATDIRGTPVTVVVSSDIGLVVPALLGFSNFHLSGTSTMLVNY